MNARLAQPDAGGQGLSSHGSNSEVPFSEFSRPFCARSATPVLAFPDGAAPEIIDHGRTGYLCPGEDEMTAAVARVDQIDRGQCRAAAERRFCLARLSVGYDRLYRAILEHPGRPAHERTGTGAP